MYIHIENWVHGQEDYFLDKYKDDFFFRGLYDSEEIIKDNQKGITKQDIINGIERHKQVKDTMYGKHWTGYYKTDEGSYQDTELLRTYTPKLTEILKTIRLYGTGIFSYSSIWGQLAKEGVPCYIKEHNHYKHPKQMLSWVHFVKVPEQKCFYFCKNGGKSYPVHQKSGDLMVFPSYLYHGVDERKNLEERFVVVGNIIML